MSNHKSTHILILAAGKGTRMCSTLPKIMHPLAGLPLIGHVLQTAKTIEPQTCTLVIAPDMKEVKDFSQQFYPHIQFALQEEQLGTGHAVQCGIASNSAVQGKVIIIFGDTPAIEAATLKTLEERLDKEAIVVVGMTPDDPKHYARILLESDQSVQKIVEYKDASDEEKELTLCNSGIIGFQATLLKELLPHIQPSSLTGEYYLFETISLAKTLRHKIGFIEIPACEVEGVNTRAELALAEQVLQQRYRQQMMLKGVTLLDPESVYFSHDTQIEQDVVIEPHVFFGPQVVVETGVHIRAFSHIEGTILRQRSKVGPFARLRPGTEIGPQARVGNFVEIKNTTLERGAKANHLTYLGDASVGEEANIGAGTITCNYDGVNKWITRIGARAFIGSHTALVAPITIGDGALIGAGSTLTKDVEAEALALTRPPITQIENGATIFRHKSNKLKTEKDAA